VKSSSAALRKPPHPSKEEEKKKRKKKKKEKKKKRDRNSEKRARLPKDPHGTRTARCHAKTETPQTLAKIMTFFFFLFLPQHGQRAFISTSLPHHKMDSRRE
jgi:hypothetical protein